MKKSKRALPLAKDRQRLLSERRNLKMARSAHAYVRGSTVKFYEWLKEVDSCRLPDGPPVWICGDCHVGNLGPVADADGRIEIQIRDLDQSVIGNPAHDLIRLGLSLATASRGSDLPGVTTAEMLEQIMEGYACAFGGGRNADNCSRPECVRIAMKDALRRSWKHLMKERLQDTKPAIPLGRRFWPLSKSESVAVRRLFGTEDVRRLVTSLRAREDTAAVEVLDAAYWVKGCSSLGRLRLAVLVGVDGAAPKTGGLCLMDLKEAVKAAAPRQVKARMPRDNGERVVTGARYVSPFLGGRMLAAQCLDRSVFLRELLPEDLKLEIDQVTRPEAMMSARYLAGVVGSAHARQMDEPTRQRWAAELTRNRSKTLDAPSWLWSSIVELVATHEAAYLEHCRRYAMTEKSGNTDERKA
jgi:uncharacterized protein (DUF2252 family)